MSSKICNNTSNKYLSKKKTVGFVGKGKIERQKNLLLNYDDVTKNDAVIIISIT